MLLKKSLVSPAQPWRAETRLDPSGVLSSHASMRLQSMPFDCKRMV